MDVRVLMACHQYSAVFLALENPSSWPQLQWTTILVCLDSLVGGAIKRPSFMVLIVVLWGSLHLLIRLDFSTTMVDKTMTKTLALVGIRTSMVTGASGTNLSCSITVRRWAKWNSLLWRLSLLSQVTTHLLFRRNIRTSIRRNTSLFKSASAIPTWR